MEIADLKLPRALHRRHHPESPWWVARCLEVEVTSQGETLGQARANLAEALALYFEDEPGHVSVGEAPIIIDVGPGPDPGAGRVG